MTQGARPILSVRHKAITIAHHQHVVIRSAKKGERSNPSNNRPISLNKTFLCKVLEYIVSSSIIKHLNNHGMLYDLQHGLREKRSCTTQLVMLVNDFVTSVYNKKQVEHILLDFRKAFDKVSHKKAGSKVF